MKHAACVERRDGRAVLLLDGQPTVPLLYGLTDAPGSRWSWEEVPARQLRLFAEHGVRLLQLDLWLLHLVDAKDRLDPDLARRQVAGAIAACPDAAVMLRLHLNQPARWLQRHPEAQIGYADAEPEDTGRRPRQRHPARLGRARDRRPRHPPRSPAAAADHRRLPLAARLPGRDGGAARN